MWGFSGSSSENRFALGAYDCGERAELLTDAADVQVRCDHSDDEDDEEVWQARTGGIDSVNRLLITFAYIFACGLDVSALLLDVRGSHPASRPMRHPFSDGGRRAVRTQHRHTEHEGWNELLLRAVK